ncbi:MAG: hypothetical protein QOJ11_3318 [Frankiales bacterium]|jgi:parallel beta-helix repeat protein|nr:hypothetical protein [Frankiales bacterium]
MPKTTTRRRRVRPTAVAATTTALVLACLSPVTTAHAAGPITRHVNGKAASCTNTGTGTTAAPYCTVQAAASAAQPGDTVLVASGTYTENVTVNHSGTATAPISFAPEVGANVTMSGQIHGFTVSGTTSTPTSWINISGFNVSHTTQYGIYLKYAAHITLDGNHVTYSGQPVNGSSSQGIYLIGTTDSLITNNVTDHNTDTGIYATTGTTNVEIRGNTSFANARQYTRAATGIDVRAPGNIIDRNRVYDNEDSGIQLYNGAVGTIVYDNISYDNGDHGIDVLNSTGVTVVANSVYSNVTAGINFEGNGSAPSTGGTVRNNISVDNGLSSAATKGDIRVDANSIPGTTLDYDLLYLKATGTLVTWGTKQYATLSALATATGQETHGLDNQNGGDPKWVSPDTGDFHLSAGSRAIDSAASSASNQPATDFEGNERVDDPSIQNIGVGPRTYDDRGALEYQPDLPPVARLDVSPTSGTAPLTVTADASASTDVDATPIATYAFDFGDGTSTGAQGGPTASHAYSTAGSFTVTVTVADSAGKSSTTSRAVTVSAVDVAPRASLSVTPSAGSAPLDVTADASGSTDTDATPIASYTFDFGDGTAVVGPQPSATATHTYASAGAFVATVTVKDSGGLATDATASVSVGNVVVDQVHYTYASRTSVAFDWHGGPSTIRYGTTGSYGSTATASAPNPMPYSSAGPFWEAVLTGLTPGATYHYSIGGSSDSVFTTAPTGPFRFDAEGDIGDSVTYPTVGTTQGQIAADAPDLVLGIGDLTYGEAHGQAAVDQHFNDVMGWSRTAAYMPAWGNHDWETSNDDLRNYKGRFLIPNGRASASAPSLGCCGEDWGWFDAGGVRFISYPEPYTTSAWTDWAAQADAIVAAAQADSSIQYVVTFGHRPAFSTGNHTGDPRLAGLINTLGDKYSKLVLNINGHSHDYERFSPIHGVTHITAGGGGATLEPPWTSLDPRTAYRAMHLAHLRVDVTASAMTIAAICGPQTSKDDMTCTQGSVIDTVTIQAPPAQDSPPTAALSLSPTSGPAPLAVTADASASTDPDATPIASYAFDFGDGFSVGTQPSPTAQHTYTTAGTYTVTTTVTDTVGRPATATARVTVSPAQADNPPTVVFSATPTTGSVPLTVNVDASSSTDNDATPIATYKFAFADGTVVGPQTGATASHTYTTAGTYALAVTVTDTAGKSATSTVSITASPTDAPPRAALTVTQLSGPGPYQVSADASASTDTDATGIATYAFDFGDGSTAGPQSGAVAAHQYAAAGSYRVVVTVTDTGGLSSTAATTVAVTNDAPPVATLTVTPSTGRAPLAVTADASGSSDTDVTPIASYRFDFGDGVVVGPQATATAVHTYSGVGSWTVTVTVTDTAGQLTKATAPVKATTPTGTNFVSNGGFETNTTGWNVSGRAGITLSRTTDPHTGSYAAVLTNTTSATAADCTLNDSPDWMLKTDAGTYTASLWVKAPTAGAKLTLRIREYNAGTFVAQKTVIATLSTTWAQVTLAYTPSVGTDLDLTAYLTNAAPGVCFLADDVTEVLS